MRFETRCASLQSSWPRPTLLAVFYVGKSGSAVELLLQAACAGNRAFKCYNACQLARRRQRVRKGVGSTQPIESPV